MVTFFVATQFEVFLLIFFAIVGIIASTHNSYGKDSSYEIVERRTFLSVSTEYKIADKFLSNPILSHPLECFQSYLDENEKNFGKNSKN